MSTLIYLSPVKMALKSIRYAQKVTLIAAFLIAFYLLSAEAFISTLYLDAVSSHSTLPSTTLGLGEYDISVSGAFNYQAGMPWWSQAFYISSAYLTVQHTSGLYANPYQAYQSSYITRLHLDSEQVVNFYIADSR